MPIEEIVSRGEGDGRRPKRRRPELLRSSSLGGGEIDFSIVVPAHNRPMRLGQCLQAIATLAYPLTRYEVIVVDDGSEDSLEPVVVPFLGRLNITLLRQPNSGPAGARNAGAAASRGRYVVFTDDDCRPDPGWLGALARRLAANPQCAVGGKTVNGLPGNLFSSASQFLIEYLYRHWNRDADDALFITSNNLAFPRARLVEVRGFDAKFVLAAAEDRELCDRWRSQGGRIVYVPDAIVHHFHALNLKTFLVQHFNYGRGALIFHDIRRQRTEQRAPIPPGSFYPHLLKFAFTREPGLRGVAVGMLVGLSQIVMPLGYLRQLYISRAETFAVSRSDRSRGTRPTRGTGEAPTMAMSAVRRFWYQLRVRVFDALKHPAMVPGGSSALFVLSNIVRPFLPATSLSLLCRSHRTLMHISPGARFSGQLNRTIERALIRACVTDGVVESVASRSTDLPVVPAGLFRKAGIVLKAPRCENDRVVEKGVLLLKNTERLDTFRRCVAMAPLLEHYTLILEPSWSGYANPKLLSFCVFRDHPIVVMSPCRADYQFLERLNSNLRPTPIGASDWVDPRVFRPLDGQDKRFDAVMIARWTLVKRHHLLFRALNRIADPTYRVALVASNIAGDTDRRAILSMIDEYRLASQIMVFEDLEPAEVNEILNQSKVNLLLSRQEGSNRSLFEGFFAGVPGLAFANNIGIPITHFTPRTGRLIAQHDLPGALLYFRKHWAKFDPRPWALANIAPEVTTARLNLLLCQLARQGHEPWTQDIACKCNRPELRYYPDESDGWGFATIEDLVAQYAHCSRGDRGQIQSPAAKDAGKAGVRLRASQRITRRT